MSQIVLTESELKLRMAQIYKEEKLNQVKKIWETFDKNEKLFVVEFYKQLHPDSKLISESKWYNWIGDIVGLVPGLELVNIVNGISYFKQGEKLFALLSLLAGLPGMGLILGPLKVLLKGGGAVAKSFKGAVALGDAAKLASLGRKTSVIGKLIKSVGGWGVSLLTVLTRVAERVPFLRTIISGLKGTINLFGSAKNIMVSKPKIKPTDFGGLKPSKLMSGPSGLDKLGGVNPSGMSGADSFTKILSSMFGK